MLARVDKFHVLTSLPKTPHAYMKLFSAAQPVYDPVPRTNHIITQEIRLLELYSLYLIIYLHFSHIFFIFGKKGGLSIREGQERAKEPSI